MRAARWVFVALVAWSGAATAQVKLEDPKPRVIDVSPFKERLRFFQDAQGGTYAVLGEEFGSKETRVWYGRGKALYEQISPRRSRNGERWSIALWAPRVADFQPATIDRLEDATYQRTCGSDDKLALVEVTGAAATALRDAARFYTTATVRQAHMLARDDRGTYYYVDRLRDLYGGKGFRVFVGRKGALKQRPLVDVASDSEGEVYSTKTGFLRLVRTEGTDRPSATWIKGKARTELVTVDVVSSLRMIYRDLGVYKSLGTICDNL